MPHRAHFSLQDDEEFPPSPLSRVLDPMEPEEGVPEAETAGPEAGKRRLDGEGDVTGKQEEDGAAHDAEEEEDDGNDDRDGDDEDASYPPKPSSSPSPASQPPPAAPVQKPRFKVPSVLAWAVPHLNWKGFRPVLRSCIAAWCGLILVLVPSTERMLGQASFLVLIVSTICPSSVPIASHLEQAFFQITFVAAAWAWSCLGLFLSHRARMVYQLSKASFGTISTAPYLNQGLDVAEITRRVQEDVYHGVYLETGASIVCAVFLAVGGGFLLWLRGRLGPGPALFGIIFGVILLSISMTIGVLFPYPFYSVGNIFFLPFICQQAIGIVCALFVFPETLGHQFCDRLIGTLSPLSVVIVQQKRMLQANPRTSAWLEFKCIKVEMTRAMGSLALMAASEANLTREVAFAKVPGKDWSRLLGNMRILVSRTTGFVSFYEIVEKHLHREFSDAKGGPTADDLVVHLGHSRPASPDRHHDDDTPASTRPPSLHLELSEDAGHQGSAAHPLPLLADRRTGGVGSSGSLTDMGEERHSTPVQGTSKRRARSHHRSYLAKNLSHLSVPSLLHEVLHPNVDLRPVGLNESQVYMDIEDYLHNPADEEHIEDIIGRLSVASGELLDACADAIMHLVTVVHRIKSTDSSLRALWYHNTAAHDANVKESATILARLQLAFENYRDVKRLEVVRPFARLFDPFAPRDQEALSSTPSHRGLFWAFSLQFSLLAWAQGLIDVTMEMIKIEKKRVRPRVWTPEWAKFKWVMEGGTFEDEKPDDIAGFSDVIHGFKRTAFTARRHADYVAPTSWFHLFGIWLYNVTNLLSRPDVLFGVKAAVLLALVALPAFFKRSTYFYQTERGVWVLIMAALTSTQYVGDTSFGFYIRVVGSFTGALIGLMVWYIGAGAGTGNPYGIAAIVGVALPFLLFYRVYFLPPPSAIFPAVTAMLVIGYSWQDANQPSLSSVGYGWAVGWRRFVCVFIGISAAFVWSLLPPKATQRETVRKTYARVIGEMGGVLCQILSFANCKSDNSKAPKQIVVNIAALRNKVQKTTASKGMIQYEISLRGAWPAEYYASLQSLQMELLDLLGQLLGVITALDRKWTTALLHRAQLSESHFLSSVLAVFQSVSNALAHNAPLPMLFTPLLESFLRPLEALKAGHVYGYDIVIDPQPGMPQHVDLATICSLEYLQFSCGISQCYAIVNRLDRLMLVTKSLVGESYLVYGMPESLGSREDPKDQHWEGDQSAQNSTDSLV